MLCPFYVWCEIVPKCRKNICQNAEKSSAKMPKLLVVLSKSVYTDGRELQIWKAK